MIICVRFVKCLLLLSTLFLFACSTAPSCVGDSCAGEMSTERGPLGQTVYISNSADPSNKHAFAFVAGQQYALQGTFAAGKQSFAVVDREGNLLWVFQLLDKESEYGESESSTGTKQKEAKNLPTRLRYQLAPRAENAKAIEVELPLAGSYSIELDVSNKQSPTLSFQLISKSHKYHKSYQNISYTSKQEQGESGASFSVNNLDYKLRRYAQTSSQAESKTSLVYEEIDDAPRLRTGILQFDALFALAMHELRKHKVDSVNNETCRCYVTTTGVVSPWELAYAIDLALPVVDSPRSFNSLAFAAKQFSNTKPQFAYALWVMAAAQQLKFLPAEKRSAYAKDLYPSVQAFVEASRADVFVGRLAAYKSDKFQMLLTEQANKVIKTSDETLLFNQNMLHFIVLRFASDLAQEVGDSVMAVKYEDWAADIKTSIQRKYWSSEDNRFYASVANEYAQTFLVSESMGQVIAMHQGIGDLAQAQWLTQSLPMSDFGVPLVYGDAAKAWQPYKEITSPVVNAYALQLARRTKRAEQLENIYLALIKAASLNLGNFTYLNVDSGKPVISAKLGIKKGESFLASTAYINMVVSALFGMQFSDTGFYFQPVLSSHIHETLLGGESRLKILNLRLHGKTINVVLHLPATANNAPERFHHMLYTLLSVELNSKKVVGEVAWESLAENNTIVVRLGRKSDAAFLH